MDCTPSSYNSSFSLLVEVLKVRAFTQLTCHFRVKEIRIRLPEIIEKLWRKRYIVIALLKNILRQLQSRL